MDLRARELTLKNSLTVLLLIVVAGLASAPSQAADNLKVCAATKADNIPPDQIIAACTAYIDAVDYPDTKAAGYYNRGNAYFDKGDFAGAVADYSAALRLRPNYPTAMFNRGLAKLHLGDKAGGDADIAASKTMKAD